MGNTQLLQNRWGRALLRDAQGAPLLPALFVMQQGPQIHLMDVRAPDEALGDRQLGSTLTHLAKGLPIYNVTFSEDGQFEVREEGRVPA